MRVCFKAKDFPDPVVKEFDSLVYNQVTNEARFYNQNEQGSVYVSFKAFNREYMHLADWCKDYESLSYEALKRRDVINTIVNDAKIDSRSINMRFVEEH